MMMMKLAVASYRFIERPFLQLKGGLSIS
jgi:hypothetical protein